MYALGTFKHPGEEAFPGLVTGEDRHSVIDLSGYGWPTLTAVLDGLPCAANLLDKIATGRSGIPLDQLEVLEPLTPRAILHSGANYRRPELDGVIAEALQRGPRSGEQAGRVGVQIIDKQAQRVGVQIIDERAQAPEPFIFQGADPAVAGPHAPIARSDRRVHHDWNLELGVVIGPGGRSIDEDDALAHVAGYVIASRPGTPDLRLGPWIVPTRFVPDPSELTITIAVNGATAESRSTADMVFDVAKLVSRASSVVELSPGDLLLTGSPLASGAEFARSVLPGDTVESAITRLGSQRSICVRERS